MQFSELHGMHSYESKVHVWFGKVFMKLPFVDAPNQKREKREARKAFISQFAVKYCLRDCKKSMARKFNYFTVVNKQVAKVKV